MKFLILYEFVLKYLELILVEQNFSCSLSNSVGMTEIWSLSVEFASCDNVKILTCCKRLRIDFRSGVIYFLATRVHSSNLIVFRLVRVVLYIPALYGSIRS